MGIPFVPKEENPPGLPQLRPIEDFWATHKDLVYEGGWEAKNDKDLIKRINDKLIKILIKITLQISCARLKLN